jgi:hypothetical protein
VGVIVARAASAHRQLVTVLALKKSKSERTNDQARAGMLEAKHIAQPTRRKKLIYTITMN